MGADETQPGIHLGTSSWSSADWVTAGFYPADLPEGKYLPFYAQKAERRGVLSAYDTVEVDSTWYRLPTAGLCQKWKRDTPSTFRFALKVTKTITHDPVLEGAEKEFEAYLSAVEELGERLGFILFQFGYFNRKSACPDLSTFLKRLAKFSKVCPPRHTYVVEIRNKTWLTGELFDALREHRFAYALTDQEWMPRPAPLWEKFGKGLITRDFAYVRFLGERERIEKLTSTWDQTVIDRTKEVEEWIGVIKELLKMKIPVWAWFNNHWSGHAPAAIEHFRRLWEAGQPM
jgi:uncharacterized protein YecE (DUF72 family)